MAFGVFANTRVLARIWQDDNPSFRRDRYARRERQNIDDDKCPRVGKRSHCLRPPFTSHFERCLIREGHRRPTTLLSPVGMFCSYHSKGPLTRKAKTFDEHAGTVRHTPTSRRFWQRARAFPFWVCSPSRTRDQRKQAHYYLRILAVKAPSRRRANSSQRCCAPAPVTTLTGRSVSGRA